MATEVVVVVVVVVVRTGASCECLSSHMRACIKLKWVSANALTPSAGLTSRSKTLRPFPPKAGSGRSQVQKPHPTPIRGKRLRDTPASLPTPSEEGGRNLFHRLGVECPWSGLLTDGTPTCVFLVGRTLLTTLLPSSSE